MREPMLSDLTREHAPWLHRLQERGDFYQCLLETTQEGVWVLDATERTVFVNERMAAMLGHTIREMFGEPVFAFMDEEARTRCAANLARRRQGRSEQLEFRLRHKDGRPIWTLLTSSPLYDERGQYAGALAMVNDITERKEAELALARTHRELERRVAERTRELAELNRHLAEIAVRDPLTSLLNRRALDERLAQELASAQRYSLAFSVLLIDVDHFKQVNDLAGHHMGDAVLRKLAALFTAQVRTSDLVARYGGEEFLVLAPHTAHDGALILAERLRSAVAEASFEPLREVTVSIGVAGFEHGNDAHSLLERADNALYVAKRSGRNCVR